MAKRYKIIGDNGIIVYSMSIFWLKVSTLLSKYKISKGEFEEFIGVSPGYFSRIRSEEIYPAFSVVVNVANYFKCTVDDLFRIGWNKISDDLYECTFCKYQLHTDNIEPYIYCNNCGTNMIGNILKEDK